MGIGSVGFSRRYRFRLHPRGRYGQDRVQKAAAKFNHNKRSHVLAASKVVTYLDEAYEKRRGIYGRALSSGAAPSSSIVKSRMLASGIINLRQGADRVLHPSANGAARQVALRWCCAHAARA